MMSVARQKIDFCFLGKMGSIGGMQPGLSYSSVKGTDCEDPSLTRYTDQGKSSARCRLHFFDRGPSRAKSNPI